MYNELLHSLAGDDSCVSLFNLALKAGLKHFPQELGLLHQKTSDGKSVIEVAYENFGRNRAWEAIKDCLDETDTTKVLGKDSDTNPIRSCLLRRVPPFISMSYIIYFGRILIP